MPDFKYTDVNSDLIASTSKSIGEDIRELAIMSSILSGSTMINLDPCWEGPAKELFEKQFTAYVAAFDRYVKAHLDLNEQLQKAGAAYTKSDETVRQSITRLPK